MGQKRFIFYIFAPDICNNSIKQPYYPVNNSGNHARQQFVQHREKDRKQRSQWSVI